MVHVRLPRALLDRLDGWAAGLGAGANRAGLIREILERACDEHEKRQG